MMMDDYYAFDMQEIDGKMVDGFVFQNEDTNWNQIFVQFNDGQDAAASDWHRRMDSIDEEQIEMIKGWLKKIKHEIEYVTPTNQDIIDCIMATGTWPVVDVCDIEDDVEFNIKWTASMLSHVIFEGGIGSGFMDIDGTYWDEARMPASRRTEWAKKLKGK